MEALEARRRSTVEERQFQMKHFNGPLLEADVLKRFLEIPVDFSEFMRIWESPQPFWLSKRMQTEFS